MATREELNQLARNVRGEQLARIKAMTREEKYAELNKYFHMGQGLKLDIDELEKDRKLQGVPEEALDQALMICAAVVGRVFNTLPMSADELRAHIPESDWAK